MGSNVCDIAYAYATALPVPMEVRKREKSSNLLSHQTHILWIPANVRGKVVSSGGEEAQDHTCHSCSGRRTGAATTSSGPTASNLWRNKMTDTEEDVLMYEEQNVIYIPDSYSIPGLVDWINPPDFLSENTESRTASGNKIAPETGVTLVRVAGIPESVSLFAIPTNNMPLRNFVKDLPQELSQDHLLRLIDSGILHPQAILAHMREFIQDDENMELHISLRALATLKAIYATLPDATVDLGVLSTRLNAMDWVKSAMKEPGSYIFCGFDLNRKQTFSCLALFESGCFDISPSTLNKVMVMAATDSIYISAALLCDPSERSQEYEMRRIRGSIGKPGIAMMIPVRDPQIRNGSQDWTLVNHNHFDGKFEDSFHTTLHLGFTDYLLPIDVGDHGHRDFEIYFLESFISVHDRGQWLLTSILWSNLPL